MLSSVVLIGVALLTGILIATAIGHVLVSTPFGGSPDAVARTMVRLAGLRTGDRVCDIGAGDARLLIAAKRDCPGIDARGYEIALGIWMLGKLRIAFSGLSIRLLLRNALRDTLSETDVLFLYVGPEMMRALLPKLRKEARLGTRVVSHTFTFPGVSPQSVELVQVGRRQKKVLLYVF